MQNVLIQVVEPRRNRRKLLFVGIGLLLCGIAFGSVFAANIRVNSDSPVEFGQGFAGTVACDQDGILITPAEQFHTHLTSSGIVHEFDLSAISISGIADDCIGKVINIQLIESHGNVYENLQFIFDGTHNDGSSIMDGLQHNVWQLLDDISVTGDGVIYLSSPSYPLNTDDFYGLTLETTDQ